MCCYITIDSYQKKYVGSSLGLTLNRVSQMNSVEKKWFGVGAL